MANAPFLDAPEGSPWLDGPILRAVQSHNIFADSKDFVDSPLVVSPAEAWRRWQALPQPPDEVAVRAFVAGSFGPPGGGLEAWAPPDYDPSPPLLSRLPRGTVRDWASALNGMWSKLGRRLSAEVRAAPERTTLLPASHGFIVPGGRFREAYCARSLGSNLGPPRSPRASESDLFFLLCRLGLVLGHIGLAHGGYA